MDTSAKQPLFVRIGNAIGSIFGSNTSHYVAPTTTPMKTYRVRGQTFTEPDVDQLKRIIYSEVSNRPPDKQELEARILFNTAVNRMAAYNTKGQPRTLSGVLTAPNQYQGYNSPLYKQYDSPADSLSAKRKAQLDSITNKMIGEVSSGQFKDNTSGAYYYKHKDDKIYYDDKKPLFATQ